MAENFENDKPLGINELIIIVTLHITRNKSILNVHI